MERRGGRHAGGGSPPARRTRSALVDREQVEDVLDGVGDVPGHVRRQGRYLVAAVQRDGGQVDGQLVLNEAVELGALFRVEAGAGGLEPLVDLRGRVAAPGPR